MEPFANDHTFGTKTEASDLYPHGLLPRPQRGPFQITAQDSPSTVDHPGPLGSSVSSHPTPQKDSKDEQMVSSCKGLRLPLLPNPGGEFWYPAQGQLASSVLKFTILWLLRMRLGVMWPWSKSHQLCSYLASGPGATLLTSKQSQNNNPILQDYWEIKWEYL